MSAVSWGLSDNRIKILNPADFDFLAYAKIRKLPRPPGNQSKKDAPIYKELVTAFDIETSRLPDVEQSIMYVWQWAFPEIGVVVGRTWDEFLEFAEKLKSVSKNARLVVYVHNLSYEFQFLRGIYHFEPMDVFALSNRKVARADMMDFLELRCSYIHSNMSLDTFTNKMGATHRKLSGEDFDYSKIRYPWTPLSDMELAYCVHDVAGLVESICIEMEHDGDDLYSVPLTSTGYVRRDAKRAMRAIPHDFVPSLVPDYDTYVLLREAFRGGNTHANRYYSRCVLHDVHSYDRSSSYPDVQVNCKYPVTPFVAVGDCDLEQVADLMVRRGKALIMRVALHGVTLRDPHWGAPYLSRDKCRHIHLPSATFDNGRVLSTEYLETTITDIDLRIILREYDFDDIAFYDVRWSSYGKLPQPLIDTTLDYYRKKTELKGVDGMELLYTKSKNKLNSIYGMMATNPVKPTIKFYDQRPENGGFLPAEEDPRELLEASKKRAFVTYQWGVWVTAWARLRLEEGIELAHRPGAAFVYCDTDSVKYLGHIDWSEYNAERRRDSEESGAWADDPHGVRHYMGVFEAEHDMVEFGTLGAKKYCFRESEGDRLQITIAGVNKRKGGPELEQAGGVQRFCDAWERPFIFREAGGNELIYNDHPTLTEYHAEGRTIPVTSNVVIKDSTYTLSITGEYLRVLEELSGNIERVY